MSVLAADMVWLERLAEDSGAKVEVDAEGSIIVAPATDDHLIAAQALHEQLLAYRPPETLVFTEGPRWNPTGAERPSYVPDVSVVDRRALRRARGVYTLSPAPLLVVEVISPESRRRDVGEKADAYFAGGALAYWTVDIP